MIICRIFLSKFKTHVVFKKRKRRPRAEIDMLWRQSAKRRHHQLSWHHLFVSLYHAKQEEDSSSLIHGPKISAYLFARLSLSVIFLLARVVILFLVHSPSTLIFALRLLFWLLSLWFQASSSFPSFCWKMNGWMNTLSWRAFSLLLSLFPARPPCVLLPAFSLLTESQGNSKEREAEEEFLTFSSNASNALLQQRFVQEWSFPLPVYHSRVSHCLSIFFHSMVLFFKVPCYDPR